MTALISTPWVQNLNISEPVVHENPAFELKNQSFGKSQPLTQGRAVHR